MNYLFKLLVVTLLVLCLTSSAYVIAYYTNGNAESYIGDMLYNLVVLPNIYIEARDTTSEGPDCRTLRWYVMDIVGKFDDALHDFCKFIGNDELLAVWRSWLKSKHGITVY